MRKLSMGLMPGPGGTRVLLVGERSETLLKALLPWNPANPEAPRKLGEALALWLGTPVSAVLCADDEEVMCGSRPWLEAAAAALIKSEQFELRLVTGNAEAQSDGDDEWLDGFEEVRAFMHRWSEL